MATLVTRKNPCKPSDKDSTQIPDNITILATLKHVYHPQFSEFSQPTLILLNGVPVMRKDWGVRIVRKDDVLSVVSLVSGAAAIPYLIAFIVAVVGSLIVMALMPKPKSPADQQAPDPVYVLSGHKNTVRVLEPIECAYGRNRLYPSYASRPFNKYRDNEQDLYQLFCLGQGEYEIHSIKIDDTPIDQFQNVTYQLVPPGSPVTLFPDNVLTVVEVSRIELFGPNEPSYAIFGPFTLNPAFTTTNKIEVDVSFPQGLYRTNDDGDLESVTVTALFEVRQIDDSGVPVGGWTTLDSFSKTLATVNTKRYTLTHTVSSGRYEIRARRTSNASSSYKTGDTLVWEAARAFLPNSQDYGNVTMLAVVAQASNNLNDNSANRINVDCTRKLPRRVDGEWQPASATRSIAWAFYDVFASAYGGNLEDTYLDLDQLEELDEIWSGQGRYFDFVFNQKSTVWEAAKTIARCGRAVPVLSGSLITLVRDAIQTVPQGVFNCENIVAGSFKWNMSLLDPKEHDSVAIEYVNRVTGLKESITCIPPGSPGVNPEKIMFAGCTDRDWAYREGMYIALSNKLIRDNITFTTGLEGFIPTYGDLVVVAYPLPTWGVSGYLVNIDGVELELSEPVEFEEGSDHFIVLRKDDGSGDGPYRVTAGSSATVVVLEDELGYEYDTASTNREPVLFSFGPGEYYSRRCRVREVTPSGGEEVEVTCSNYTDEIFVFDSEDAPAITDYYTPPTIPDAPAVSFLTANRSTSSLNFILVSWAPALGAKSYVLQKSDDGSDWSTVAETTGVSWQLSVDPGQLYLRVAGVGSAKGEWAEWDGVVGLPIAVPLTVQNLSARESFTGTTAKIKWSPLYDADNYVVEVYDDATLLRASTVSITQYDYSIEMAVEDGTPARELTFKVFGQNDYGSSESPAMVVLSNPVPNSLTSGFSSSVKVETSTDTVYTLSWPSSGESDTELYYAWASTSSGFTPSGGNLKFAGNAQQCDVTVPRIARNLTITNITNDNPAVVTTDGNHLLTSGESVSFSGVSGMVEMNGQTAVVSVLSSNTFSVNIDSTGYSTYSSGGIATTINLYRRNLYWKVAYKDVWGAEYTASAQQTAS